MAVIFISPSGHRNGVATSLAFFLDPYIHQLAHPINHRGEFSTPSYGIHTTHLHLQELNDGIPLNDSYSRIANRLGPFVKHPKIHD
jgi:hypothetical protein